MVTLLFLAIVLLSAVRWRPPGDVYRVILEGLTLWGAILVLGTELLSLGGALERGPVIAFWTTVCACSGLLLARRRVRWGSIEEHARTWVRRAADADLRTIEVGLAAGVLISILALLMLALVAAPNNFDSMTYHLARVVHWAQAGSVNHYPTHIERQVYMGPGAEFAVLHTWLLAGGDRFAGLVQWGAMLGSLIGAAWIAKLLGGQRREQLIAAVVTATLPMGILQATTTQNDYVTSFWLVCFAAFGLAATHTAERGRVRAVSLLFAGLALGLALLTKGTAYLFAAPFGILLVWRTLRSRGPVLALAEGAGVVVLALALNVGHSARNISVYGSPLGPPSSETGVLNDTKGLDVLLSNVVRNSALHLSTPLGSANDLLEQAVRQAHDLVGIDPSDPQTTFRAENMVPNFRIPRFRIHEDFSGNPLHLVLLGFTVVAVAFSSGLRRQAGPYALALAAAAVLYFSLIRWQEWGTRLQLPLFVTGTPLVALTLSRLGWRRAAWISMTLLLVSVPYVTRNRLKLMVGRGHTAFNVPREEQYFSQRSALRLQYSGVTDEALRRGCETVGLVLGLDDWEYPLQLGLGAHQPGAPEIFHYRVTNRTRETAQPSEPMCVIRTGSSPWRADSVLGLREAFSGPDVSLWTRSEP